MEENDNQIANDINELKKIISDIAKTTRNCSLISVGVLIGYVFISCCRSKINTCITDAGTIVPLVLLINTVSYEVVNTMLSATRKRRIAEKAKAERTNEIVSILKKSDNIDDAIKKIEAKSAKTSDKSK